MKKTRKPTFKMPNSLICNDALSYSARRLGAVLYARRNALGCSRKSLEQLSELSGCAVATVRKGLVELEEAGYVSIQRCYKYSGALGRLVYARPIYQLDLSFKGGYTQMPRDIFAYGGSVGNATFVVLMYLHQQAGNGTRAYPSINRVCRALGMGCSSVCRALQAIKELSCWLVRRCVKKNRAFACNSYHVVNVCEKVIGATVSFVGAMLRLAAVRLGVNSQGGSPCSYYSPGGGNFQDGGVLPKLAN